MLALFPCFSPKLQKAGRSLEAELLLVESSRGVIDTIYKHPVCNNVDTPTFMQGTYLTRISGSLSERSSFSCKREQNTVSYCDEECTDILHVPCCLGPPLVQTWVDLRAQVNQQRSQAAPQSVFDVRVTFVYMHTPSDVIVNNPREQRRNREGCSWHGATGKGAEQEAGAGVQRHYCSNSGTARETKPT